MEISWYGLSCFRLTERGMATVVTDPYDHSVVGLEQLKLRGEIVTVSHDTPGHNFVKVVKGRSRVITGPGEFERVSRRRQIGIAQSGELLRGLIGIRNRHHVSDNRILLTLWFKQQPVPMDIAESFPADMINHHGIRDRLLGFLQAVVFKTVGLRIVPGIAIDSEHLRETLAIGRDRFFVGLGR